jgi:zinc protease
MRKLAIALLLSSCATTPVQPQPAPRAEAEPLHPEAVPAEPATPVASAPVPVFPQDDFRAKQPSASSEPRPLKLPAINKFKLKNGVQVYLVEDHTLPKIEVSFESDSGGTISDPAGKEGLARLCTATMTDSTEKLDKVAFSGATADLGLRLSAGATADMALLNLTTLSKNWDAAAALFTDVLLHPGLRPEDLARNALASKAALKQAKGSPASLASLLLPHVLYGAKHPLARIPSDASLDAITVDDCKAYHKASFRPVGARLWISGDITRAQIEAMAASEWKDWTGKGKPAPRVPPPRPERGRLFFVDVPGAAQSAVYVMELGPARKDPGYLANTLMTAILGGGFASRINMLARETKGYAYGASGHFRYQRSFGSFVAVGSIKTASTAEAVTDFMAEIARMAATGEVTDEELQRERQNLILSLPADFETASDVLWALSRLHYYGLPLDYYDSFVAKAQKVDKQAVASAAKKWLKPAKLIVFVVGDGQVVRADLEKLLASGKLGKGAWVELDTDGKVIPTPTN